MYGTKATTRATINITMKLRNQVAPLLHRVVILRSSTTSVEHCLSELVSRRGIALWVRSLRDIDMNVLDHHKNHEKQCNLDLTQFDIGSLYLTRVAWNWLKFVIIPKLARAEVVGARLRNQVVSTLVWLWWVIDLLWFEFESGIFWLFYPIICVENRVCLSRGVLVTGLIWRAAIRIVAGVGDLV
jgi:hypothetical protein